jgi:regulator of protease activity HflC (stomatin/prohibitin superfamily)
MDNRVVDMNDLFKQIKLPVILIMLAIAGILVYKFKPWVTVPAGFVGVKLRFQAVTGQSLPEGLNFILPWINDVVIMDTRTQKKEVKAAAASKDLQDTASTIAVNFSLMPNKAHEVYRTIGVDYENKIIDPAVQQEIKTVTAQYTVEELITQRQKVSEAILSQLKKRLGESYIDVESLSIVDFDYSEQYRQSIEEKQIAEQRKLKALRDLERIKIEAEQKVAQATAEAEALKLQKENISPDLIELRRIEASIMAIQKWDGKLPNITSGVIPFIDAKSLKD